MERRMMKKGYLTFALFAGLLVLSALVGKFVDPTWKVEPIELDVQKDDNNQLFYMFRESPRYVSFTPYGRAILHPENIEALTGDPGIDEEFVVETNAAGEESYWHYVVSRHWGFWSLLPALVAVLLCWVTREPITALAGGIVSGAFILTQYDIFGDVVIEHLGTAAAAGVLVLYLWLLGGLMGGLVQDWGSAGVCAVHDGPICTRTQNGKARGLGFGRHLLPRGYRQYRACRHDSETDC